MNNWRLRDNPESDCGAKLQTMKHTVSECEKRKFSGALQELHAASDEAIQWLNNVDVQKYDG